MNEKVKEAKREYHRQWRKNNAEKVKAYQKAYRERNKAKWKSYDNAFYNRLAEENNNGQ